MMKRSAPTLRNIGIMEMMSHPGLLGRWYNGASWDPWRAVLKATNGLPMSDGDVDFVRQVANRAPPKKRIREAWYVVSRRGGKDSIAAGIATHAAVSFDPAAILRPGERAVVACVAHERDAGKIIWRYIESYFDQVPPLKRMETRLAESDGVIELNNSVDVLVLTGSHRALRGRPILCAVLDEVCLYRDETSSSTAPDMELYRALLPGLSTIPQAQIIGISSPYKRSGLLFERWRKHYGQDSDDVFVIQAASHVMNPVLDTRDRDRQMEEDPTAARSEWYGEWRDDLVAFIDPTVVDNCVVKGRAELPYVPGITYVAGVDPSGGSSDSMTLSISHAIEDRGILDLAREWRAPFNPDDVVREIADICRRYGITRVIGDRYAGEWVRERFRVHGITYELASLTRSDLYLTLLPALNSPGRIELLDHKRVVSQLCALERRTARSGKDSVDHPKGQHDDVINAAAISLVVAALAPKSSADHWLEYMRRECEAAGIATTPSSPNFGYSFNADDMLQAEHDRQNGVPGGGWRR
jgi:hypothetical protein